MKRLTLDIAAAWSRELGMVVAIERANNAMQVFTLLDGSSERILPHEVFEGVLSVVFPAFDRAAEDKRDELVKAALRVWTQRMAA